MKNFRISFVNLEAIHTEIKDELDSAFKRVLESGNFILGPEVVSFEAEFANYCQAMYCAGTNSGLEALHLILRAYDIGPGTEVIVPTNTFIATWLAVTYSGATLVPVEPNELTYNLNPGLIEKAITKRTKGIIAVHLYGQPTDMDPIWEIANRYGLKVIEDACQAHGANYKKRRVGGLGHAAVFSFYPIKNLGALGDGGVVVTNNKEIYENVCVLRNYGARSKYYNEKKGFNARLDELQAAFLRVKLKKLDGWNNRRKQIAKRYLLEIKNPNIILPFVPRWADPVWHLFVVRTKKRDELKEYLETSGIGTMIHYPTPPHKQPAYKEMNSLRFPVAETLANEVLSLPLNQSLKNEEVTNIIECINKF